MFCRNCRAPLVTGARFCATCGAPQDAAGSPGPHLADGGPPSPAFPERPGFGSGPAAGPPSWTPPDDPPTSWPGPVPAGPATTSGRKRSRLPLLAVVGAVAVVALAVVVVLPIVSGDDDGGGSEMVEMSGSHRVSIPESQTSEPNQKWAVDADVGEGVSFAVGSRTFYSIESDDGGGSTLVARALSDGKETWSEGLPDSGSLFLGDGQLIVRVSDDDDGNSAELRSYDPGDGELRWSADAESDLYEVQFFGDRILGTGGESLVAYRPEDGREMWSEDSGASFAVSGDRVYLADGDELKAVALGSGDEAWTADMSGDVTSVVLAGNAILASVGDEVVAVDKGSGKERWQEDFDTGDGATLHAVSGSVVVVAGYEQAVAIDPGSGKELDDDQFSVDEDDWLSFGYRLPDGKLLLFGYEDVVAKVFDAGTGEQIGQVDNAREISRTMIYAIDDGELSGYGLDDGERRWKVDIDDVYSVRAGDGLLVVQTDDGFELWT